MAASSGERVEVRENAEPAPARAARGAPTAGSLAGAMLALQRTAGNRAHGHL
jgi:hypothetical protein